LLSMLWESADAGVALSKRFGFADAASAAGWIGDILWDTWAITTDNCSSLVISGANLLAWIMSDDKPFIAKWSVDSQRFQRLSDTAALAVWLHDSGLPVAAPVPARDGRLRVELDNISLGVFPVIEGVLLDAGDLAQAAEAGRMLATLHEAMAAYPRNIDGGQAARHEQLVHNDFRS
jgi:homoserine kinase type II